MRVHERRIFLKGLEVLGKGELKGTYKRALEVFDGKEYRIAEVAWNWEDVQGKLTSRSARTQL